MQRGFAFKLMAPKDIAQILGMIGVHPAVTPENIDKPTIETASSMYQHLAEFAFDMDIQQVKARAPEIQSVGQFMEIFDEAMDVVAIFKLARQLAFINRVEDFSMKDMWDPQAKRLRAVLSGMINFCRYKESQTNIITTMKQEVQALDSIRLELVDKSNALGSELAEAQATHSAELQDMWVAENELQEANNVVDKLQKQKQTADRLHEAAESKLGSGKERLADNERRAEQLREHTESLQEQVAESPEGLEREVSELQLAIRTNKGRVEEKSDEKRSRTQRVQVLGRLNQNIEQYKESLDKVAGAAALQTSACERTRAARSDLANMRSTLEARRGEEVELAQAVQQMTADIDAAKQVHDDNVRECEERRQQATVQQQELQGKRSEEERQWSELQAQRTQLEAEIAAARRAHEAEMNDFHTTLRTMQEEGETYVQTIEGMLTQCDAEAGRNVYLSGCRPVSMPSPGSARGRRRSHSHDNTANFSCSPSLKASPAPRRLIMERSGY
jgi:chromosome segregation ATPase